MTTYIKDGVFQMEGCPPDTVGLKLTDAMAQHQLWHYANAISMVDPDLSGCILSRLEALKFKGPPAPPPMAPLPYTPPLPQDGSQPPSPEHPQGLMAGGKSPSEPVGRSVPVEESMPKS